LNQQLKKLPAVRLKKASERPGERIAREEVKATLDELLATVSAELQVR
jgi:hypothetical protein